MAKESSPGGGGREREKLATTESSGAEKVAWAVEAMAVEGVEPEGFGGGGEEVGFRVHLTRAVVAAAAAVRAWWPANKSLSPW